MGATPSVAPDVLDVGVGAPGRLFPCRTTRTTIHGEVAANRLGVQLGLGDEGLELLKRVLRLH